MFSLFSRFCVTVNKNSNIRDVKNSFLSMAKKKDCQLNMNQIVLAEVDRSASVSILVSVWVNEYTFQQLLSIMY